MFANCQSISSLFIAIHSWSGRCSQKSQTSIEPVILEVQGLSKSSMLIRLKSLSLVLVVIGSMTMPICNRFHERLANNGKIPVTTFTEVRFFDTLVCRFRDMDCQNLSSMLKISYGACHCLSQLILAQFAFEICLAARNHTKKPYFGIQGYPRSLISMPIKSQWTTSYWWLIVT